VPVDVAEIADVLGLSPAASATSAP
jgi:hypothetical protein